MSDPEKPTKASAAVSIAAEAATQIVAAGGAALATGSTPSAAAIQAAAAAIPGLVSSVRNLLSNRREKNTKQWLQWALTPNGVDEVTADQFAAFIEENAEEPWVFETVMESVRALDEMVSEDAIPPLGRLAREYLSGKKRPERFYRGFRRFLADCTAEELLALQELCKFLLANTREDGEEESYRVTCSAPNKLTLYFESFKSQETLALFQDMARVFRSLRVNELADDGDARSKGGALYPPGPHAIQLSRAVAARIASCLQ